MLKHITGELGWAFGKLGGIIQSVANGGVLGILEAGVSTIAIKTIEKFRKAHEVTRKARKVSIHARLAMGDLVPQADVRARRVSIHARLATGDIEAHRTSKYPKAFQFTPVLRRATHGALEKVAR